MALSSRLAVSGQISVIIRPDIRYYLAGYLVLSGRISGIIWPDIRYYLAGYPVRQLAGYPNPALKNCRISGIRLSGYVSISRISGIRQNHYPVHPYTIYTIPGEREKLLEYGRLCNGCGEEAGGWAEVRGRDCEAAEESKEQLGRTWWWVVEGKGGNSEAEERGRARGLCK